MTSQDKIPKSPKLRFGGIPWLLIIPIAPEA